MTLDIRARATAQRLLAKFGKACTLKRITAGVYDPDTGAVAQTVATIPCTFTLMRHVNKSLTPVRW